MDVLQQIAAAAGVILLLGAALHFLRSRQGTGFPALRRGARRLEALERLPLSPQHALHLVRVEGRTLLIASSPAGCTVLERPAGEAEDGR